MATQFFGAFLTISSADVPSIISDLDCLIYRCKNEFLGSHSEIYCTADTYLPLIYRFQVSARNIHFGFDRKLQVLKPSSFEWFIPAVQWAV